MKCNLQVPDHMQREKQSEQLVEIMLSLSKAILRFIYVYPYFYMDFNSTKQSPCSPKNFYKSMHTAPMRGGLRCAEFSWKLGNHLQPQQPMKAIYGCARTLSITI